MRWRKTVDNKVQLDSADDAARVITGGSWRLPSIEEFEELIRNCSLDKRTMNGVPGFRIVGPNGNCIFLPAAGYRVGKGLREGAVTGAYWSSTLYKEHSPFAYGAKFFTQKVDNIPGPCCWGANERFLGMTIRPVCSESKN